MKRLLISFLVLISVGLIVQSTHAQRRNRSGSSPASPVKPCNQLTGEDLLVRGRKCSFANGQITTVGSFCDDMTISGARCPAASRSTPSTGQPGGDKLLTEITVPVATGSVNTPAVMPKRPNRPKAKSKH